MIYKKIKKEKRKCIFRTTREFICLNLFRPHSVFFPPKKILPYLCYVFPPLKSNISPFFPCPIFFVLLPVIFFSCSYIYCLKVPFCEFGIPIFFKSWWTCPKKKKKERGKQKTEKTRQCNLKKNFKKRKKKKIQKMCTPKQQKQTNEWNKSEWLQNIFAQAIKSKKSSPRIPFLRIFKLINNVKAMFGKLTFLYFKAWLYLQRLHYSVQ